MHCEEAVWSLIIGSSKLIGDFQFRLRSMWVGRFQFVTPPLLGTDNLEETR